MNTGVSPNEKQAAAACGTVIPMFGTSPVQQLINRAEYRFIGPNGSIYINRDQAFDDLREELANDIDRALKGKQYSVPTWVKSADGKCTEKLQGLADAIVESLDHESTGDALLAVFKDSTCPLVARLRECIVSSYVALNADGIFSARGG